MGNDKEKLVREDFGANVDPAMARIFDYLDEVGCLYTRERLKNDSEFFYYFEFLADGELFGPFRQMSAKAFLQGVSVNLKP